MVSETNTPYDDVFRTTVNDCPRLILPVFNELFRTEFTGNEIIVKTENEIFLHKQEGEEAMGGNILEYEAKTILNTGKVEGKAEGKELGLSAMVRTLQKYLFDFDADFDAIVQNEEYRTVTKEQVMKYYS